MVRIGAQLLAFNVVAGQLAQAKLVGIVAYALKAQFAAEFLKVEVVAVGQRFGHVHAEAGQLHRRVAGDQPLRKSSQGHRKLDGGAGLGARGKCKPLIDHGQNAPVGGVDHHRGAVHVAHRVNCRLANHRVFARRNVAFKDISVGEGAGGKALKVMMMASRE